MKVLRPTLLIRVALYGGLMVLAASLWAWAIGANVLYGVVSGAVLGLGAAIYLDEPFNESHDEGGFESLSAFLVGVMIVLLLIALCIIAAIVGIVRRVL